MQQPEEVLRALADSSQEVLECRDFGHSWGWVTDYVIGQERGTPKVVERQIKCRRCERERSDVYSLPHFETVSSRTTYPKGYLIKGVNGRISKADVRRVSFEKVYEPISINRNRKRRAS